MRAPRILTTGACLLALAGGAAAQETGDAITPDDTVAYPGLSDNEPALRRTTAPDDPLALPERRVGALIVTSTVSASLRGTTNATDASGGGDGVALAVSPEFRLRTDWSRHQAEVGLHGTWETFVDGAAPDNLTGGVDGALRLDLADQWQATVTGAYDYGQQEPSDPDTPGGLDDRPGIHAWRAGGELAGGATRLRVTLAGDLERTDYEDGTSGGLPVDQGDRDNLLATGRLRLGYDTGTMTPFVEAEVDRRTYDRTVDTNGLARAATGTALRAGIAIDRGPVLEGEVALGVARKDYDDPALDSLSAVTVDGALAWSPVRLVTVTGDISTMLNPTTDISSSGSVDVSGNLEWAYAWTPRFTLAWRAGYGQEHFDGTGVVDTHGSFEVEGRWRQSRNLELTASAKREWLKSTAAGRDYTADSVQVGLTHRY